MANQFPFSWESVSATEDEQLWGMGGEPGENAGPRAWNLASDSVSDSASTSLSIKWNQNDVKPH